MPERRRRFATVLALIGGSSDVGAAIPLEWFAGAEEPEEEVMAASPFALPAVAESPHPARPAS